MSGFDTRSLWQGLIAAGKAEFLVQPDARYSYADLASAVRRWLAAFDTAGLDAGDRLLIRTQNEFAAISCFIAALLDGVVPVPLVPDTPGGSLVSVHDFVEPGACVLDRGSGSQAGHIGSATLVIDRTAQTKTGLFGMGRKADPLPGLGRDEATRSPRLPQDPAGLAYILFTSGTTSSPCGVMITRGNVFANLATLTRLFDYGRDSRIFNDMVLAHGDGLVQGPLLALANRCALIRSGGLELGRLEGWLNRVRQERATHVIAVPTVWALVDAYASHDDYFDSPECRMLMSVADTLPNELWRRIESRFGRPLANHYGLSETVASALYAGPGDEMGGFGTVGRPVDCEARIDPAAADQGEGELQLRGSNVSPGYWRNPQRTDDSVTPDGWFKTGDLARALDDGSYKLLGRIKNVVMMAGYLIRPDEVDEAMQRHPAVRESVTIGLKDELFGEIPVTAVVCTSPVDSQQLAAHACGLLQGFKVPKRIEQVDAIPRGISGKPRFAELRSMLAQMADLQGTGHAGEIARTGAPLETALLALAADIFRAEPGVLTLRSRIGDVPGWDSFSQLSFVIAAEQQFGVAISAARVAAIMSIGDMVQAVEDAQA